MIVPLGIVLDFVAYACLQGWYTYFTLAALLGVICKEKGASIDVITLGWLGMGLLGLCAVDVTKYGRCGASWGMLLIGFCIFRLLRHYFLSSRTILLVLILLFVILLDVFGLQVGFLKKIMSWSMTGQLFLGTLLSITLVFLGVRGSRF